jgi:hypothetical protein
VQGAEREDGTATKIDEVDVGEGASADDEGREKVIQKAYAVVDGEGVEVAGGFGRWAGLARGKGEKEGEEAANREQFASMRSA